MTTAEFESLLSKASEQLNADLLESKKYHDPAKFAARVLEVLERVAHDSDIKVKPSFHRHAFPDICANGFGVEVKYTDHDSWLSTGNSVFEGMRDQSVKEVWIMFGKAGGMPAVRWGKYEQVISHVRISHAPRFCVDMSDEPGKAPLFERLSMSYEDFCKLKPQQKMKKVREYARGRLKPGEVIWWLEDDSAPGIPLEIKLYTNLPPDERLWIRAVASLLFPQIVGGSRDKNKYKGVAFFLLKYFNVMASQTRDLFSAGSAAGTERGGDYVRKGLQNVESLMRKAAKELPDELFVEYWDKSVKPKDRIKEWLTRADAFAKDWTPSTVLFKGDGPTDLFTEE